MQFSAAQIAALINGKLEGNPEVLVSNFGKIEDAQAGQLTFLANPKYEEYLYSTRASVIIVNDTQVLKEKINATLILVPDAYLAFASLLSQYQEMMNQQLTGIQEPVYISKTALLGEKVFIGAFAYIGNNVKIG
ncbi:MAG TPA: LpxD N-terminal domain-containing protein, partial [Puia sp.]|nr:LpxD N-terminal domain-containing protein [Puia sp.]